MDKVKVNLSSIIDNLAEEHGQRAASDSKRVAILKSENQALREANKKLNEQIEQLTKEKEDVEGDQVKKARKAKNKL